MAIYFGNLDRELADRQNVLKEDAARKYRGYRDVQQSFGSLGTTVSSTIKDVAQAKLDRAKLEYNVSRNKKADEIRAEQHSQATTRNRELTLDSTLKNIAGFRKSSIEDYIGKLWFWRDPKAVRVHYTDRMKVFSADKDNLDPAKRIRMYPNLFGTEAVRKLTAYEVLVQNKVSDTELQEARNKLPLTPMNFMAWAKDNKYYNTKMKGISPTKIPNAMQRAALIEYGYDIPDAEELFKEASQEASQENGTPISIEEEPEVTSGTKIGDELGGGVDLTSTADIISEYTGREKADDDKLLGVYEDESGILHPVDKFMEDNLDDEVSRPSVEDTAASEMLPTIPPIPKRETTYNERGDIISLSDLDEKILADQKAAAEFSGMTAREDAIDLIETYSGHPGRKRQEVQLAVDNANSFSIAAEVVGPSVADTIVNSLYGNTDEVVKEIIDESKIIDTPERRKKIESRDREELVALRGAIDYKNLPAYKDTGSWVTLSLEEKNKLSKHPAIDVYGANPEKVFNYEKARENLAEKDDEIGYLKDQVSKHTPYLTEEQNLASFKKIGSALVRRKIEASGGKKGKEYPGLIGTNPQAERAKQNLAMRLPELDIERKELLAKTNTAEAAMVASQTKNVPPRTEYVGKKIMQIDEPTGGRQYDKDTRVWGPPSVISPSAIPDKVGYVDRRQAVSESEAEEVIDDEWVKGAIEANYAEDTQEEIIGEIIEREGYGLRDAGYSYYDGTDPDEKGYYKKDGGEILTLAGGNNIYGTINTMPGKEQKEAIKEITDGLFGEGNSGERPYITKGELLRFLNMPKKDHNKVYDSAVNRGRLRLTRPQMKFLTGFSYRNHLERMVKHHPYLSGIAQFPKEMQVFLMDNAFNMGPRWLKDKFIKTEVHLKNWVTKGRKSSDLEKMMKEYKDSDHWRKTKRAQSLVALLDRTLIR